MAGGGQTQDPAVGLCSVCARAARQRSARGSVFWRCRAADDDPRLPRYPPLPVSSCGVFAPRADAQRTRRA